MYNNNTAEFAAAIKNRMQERRIYADFTYIDATGTSQTVTLTENDFVANSFSLEKSCLPSSSFGLGDISSADVSFSLFNEDKKYINCKFNNAEITFYFGIKIESGLVEYCPVGTYCVDSSSKTSGNIINFTASDAILRAEKTFVPAALLFPCSVLELLEFCCRQCNITLKASQSFTCFNYQIDYLAQGTFTYRDVISWIAIMCCGFAFINRDNKLEIRTITMNTATAYELDPDVTRMSCEVDEAITIDSVAYTGAEKNYLIGAGNYSINIANNDLFDVLGETNLNTMLNNIFNAYDGFKYYPCDVEYMGDPRIDAGDCIFLKSTADGDIYTFINKHVLSLETTSEISTPSCDVLDKNFLDNNKNKKNQVSSSGVGGDTPTEEEHDNLLLLSVFNTATLPEMGGNGGTITTTSGIVNLDCISSKCSLGTSTKKYMNQLIFPAQCLTEGTYTFSFLCRRTTETEAFLNSSNYKYFYKILDVDKSANNLKDQFATNWATSVMITNHGWEWVSFTFSLTSTIKRPIIVLQCYQLGAGTYSNYQEQGAVECIKAMLETGSSFTKYKESSKETININGTTSGYPMIMNEILSVKSADCSIPVCRLTNCDYTPGSSHITLGMASDYIHVTRVFNNEFETGYTQKDYGIEMFNIAKTRTPAITNPTKTIIQRDTTNNLNITCNSLILNGTAL